MSVSRAYLEKKAFENLTEFILELYEDQENCEDLKDILYLIDVLEESVALAKEALVRDLMSDVIGEVESVFTELLEETKRGTES